MVLVLAKVANYLVYHYQINIPLNFPWNWISFLKSIHSNPYSYRVKDGDAADELKAKIEECSGKWKSLCVSWDVIISPCTK